MYYIHFYVPESHLEIVKEAVFAQGAGRIGNYEHCAWQVLGQGQYRPLEGSQSFLGEVNQLSRVVEYKVEMVCADGCIDAVIVALKSAHPYEEPAYIVMKVT